MASYFHITTRFHCLSCGRGCNVEAAYESESPDAAAHGAAVSPLMCATCGQVGTAETATRVTVIPISAKEYAEWVDAPASLHVRCEPECFGLRGRTKKIVV